MKEKKLFFDSFEAKQLKKEVSDLLFQAHTKLEILCKGIAKDSDNDSGFHIRIVRIAKTMENITSSAHEVNFL